MKVTWLQENLARGLGIVGRAVALRSTLPITANVLITTDHGRIKLAATNLDMALSCWIGRRDDRSDAGPALAPKEGRLPAQRAAHRRHGRRRLPADPGDRRRRHRRDR